MASPALEVRATDLAVIGRLEYYSAAVILSSDQLVFSE